MDLPWTLLQQLVDRVLGHVDGSCGGDVELLQVGEGVSREQVCHVCIRHPDVLNGEMLQPKTSFNLQRIIYPEISLKLSSLPASSSKPGHPP